MKSKLKRMPAHRMFCVSLVMGLVSILCSGLPTSARGDTVLDFGNVPPEPLSVFNPYADKGFTLYSSSGGFVVNAPDKGNGSPQAIGNNPFFAGATGLAAFAPATITLQQTSGDPFSLLSIDLARNFAFDPAPTVNFTGILNGGGTVTETFTVTDPSPPLAFQTFDFTGFTGVTSVSWDQSLAAGLHQFGNIHVATAAPVPESGGLGMAAGALVIAGTLLVGRRRA